MEDDSKASIVANKIFVQWLHKTTRVPMKVIQRLDKSDEWTFVITLHAMIETALNDLITRKLGFPELSDIIARFDTGDRQRGKLAWVKALKLLSDEDRAFVRILSQLRNDIVHEVSAFDFSFSKWISEMSAPDFKNLNASLEGTFKTDFTKGGKPVSRAEALKHDTRDIIFGRALMLIIKAYRPDTVKNPDAPDQSNPKE
jgi:hypothetical protein